MQSIGPLVLLLRHPLLRSSRCMTKRASAEMISPLFGLLFLGILIRTTRVTFVKVDMWLDADLARLLEASIASSARIGLSVLRELGPARRDSSTFIRLRIHPGSTSSVQDSVAHSYDTSLSACFTGVVKIPSLPSNPRLSASQ